MKTTTKSNNSDISMDDDTVLYDVNPQRKHRTTPYITAINEALDNNGEIVKTITVFKGQSVGRSIPSSENVI